MGNEEVDLISVSRPTERTLLERYNIPIDNLSYEFISECINGKILERIVLILRSGEEGIYPDLTKHAEERLARIKPASTVLRKAMPVLRSNMLNSDERQEINNEISEWRCEMKSREKDLNEGRASLLNDSYPQPEIRRTKLEIAKDRKTGLSEKKCIKPNRISSYDYAAWDKYDVDTEINRIDLQEEQRQTERRRVQEWRKELAKTHEMAEQATIDKLSLTGTELDVMAGQEREKGNEAFRAADYEEALRHYNVSITMNPNPTAYNNRAMAFIKLQRYEDALNDCNIVLGMDHTNIKALLRRALSLEHLEKSQQALADYQAVLTLEPTNKTAISGVKKLRKPCESRKVRMKIQEEDIRDTKDKVEQLSSKKTVETDSTICPKQRDDRDICYCDRAPSSSQNVAAKPHAKAYYCEETKNSKKAPDVTANKSNRKITDVFSSRDKLSAVVKDFAHTNKMSKSHDTVSGDNISTIRCELLSRPHDIKRNLEKSVFTYASSSHKGKSSSLIIEELPNVETCEKPSKTIDSIQATAGMKEKETRKLCVNKNKELRISFRRKNKTTMDVMSKEVQETNACQEESEQLETNIQGLENIESPYEFLRVWQSLKDNTNLKLHAKLLRSISHEDVNKIIGNKLDATMFSLILRCLAQQFCTPEDTVLLTDILHSLSRLSRFSIVCMFMDSRDKEVMENILHFLEKQGSPKVFQLRQIYQIS